MTRDEFLASLYEQERRAEEEAHDAMMDGNDEAEDYWLIKADECRARAARIEER